MIHQILADAGARISDQKNSSAVIAPADGFLIAILNRNSPSAYLFQARAWEAIMEQLEDIQLAEIVKLRANEVGIPVNIDDL